MSVSTNIHTDPQVIAAVRELALEEYSGPGRTSFKSQEKYRWLREEGSRLWLDTGDAQAAENVWGEELEAMTTNNTLVNQIVQTGAMDGLITYAARKLKQARPDMSDHDLIIEIAFLVNARLALSLVERFGAHVSVELHPDLGFDVQNTLAFARRYYEINPDSFYVKVPMTPDGFISTRILSNEGIPVNYTLGFSARQNYLATKFSQPRFVNVFLGRLNSVVQENNLGKPENIGEKATLASFETVMTLQADLPEKATYQIAASMRSGTQVPLLAGVDVLTMPPKVAGEYLDMSISRNDIRQHTSDELQVELYETEWTERIEDLWHIDERFTDFVDDAINQAEHIENGKQIIELARTHGIDLFHEWSAEERNRIRETGKIPDLSQWKDVPLDDLMSISALESFVKDQVELDQRIERLIRES